MESELQFCVHCIYAYAGIYLFSNRMISTNDKLYTDPSFGSGFIALWPYRSSNFRIWKYYWLLNAIAVKWMPITTPTTIICIAAMSVFASSLFHWRRRFDDLIWYNNFPKTRRRRFKVALTNSVSVLRQSSLRSSYAWWEIRRA